MEKYGEKYGELNGYRLLLTRFSLCSWSFMYLRVLGEGVVLPAMGQIPVSKT